MIYPGLCHFLLTVRWKSLVGEREEWDHDQTKAGFKCVPPTPASLSSWIILYLVTRIHRSAHILKDTHAQAYGVPVALACFTLKAESAFFRL